MKPKQPELCRALNSHAWRMVGPIVVLRDDDRRITLQCIRCDTYRSDVWTAKVGIIRTRYYRHAAEYASFIKEHTNAEARTAILAEIKEVVHAPSARETSLRSLPNETKKGRGPHSKPAKRPRDKRRTNQQPRPL